MNAARFAREHAVRAWQRTVRRPENSVLVVASPLDPVLVRGDAARMLAGWRARGQPLAVSLPPLPPPPPRKTLVLPYLYGGLTEVELTCRLPGRTDANAASLQVLRAMLYDRLFDALREGAGVYVVGASAIAVDPRVSLLGISATTAPEQAAAAIEAMHAVLERAAAGTGPNALARGKLTAESEIAVQLASMEGTFELLSEAAREGRTLDGVRGLQDAVRAVDAPALAALLQDCVGHEVTTVVGPDPQGITGDRVDFAAWQAQLVEASK